MVSTTTSHRDDQRGDQDGDRAAVLRPTTKSVDASAALALFADLVHAAGDGPVADVGCGPGHVTAHLHKLGVDAFGIDLSRQ